MGVAVLEPPVWVTVPVPTIAHPGDKSVGQFLLDAADALDAGRGEQGGNLTVATIELLRSVGQACATPDSRAPADEALARLATRSLRATRSPAVREQVSADVALIAATLRRVTAHGGGSGTIVP